MLFEISRDVPLSAWGPWLYTKPYFYSTQKCEPARTQEDDVTGSQTYSEEYCGHPELIAVAIGTFGNGAGKQFVMWA